MEFRQRSLMRQAKILASLDGHLEHSRQLLSSLQSDAEKVFILEPTEKSKDLKSGGKFRANAFQIAEALGDPIHLVKAYTRKREYTRAEDLAAHKPVYTDGLYRLQPPRPKIPFRDADGRKILTNLEVYKRHWSGKDAGLWSEAEEDREMLFRRNWPMTEPNAGKSVSEFVWDARR